MDKTAETQDSSILKFNCKYARILHSICMVQVLRIQNTIRKQLFQEPLEKALQNSKKHRKCLEKTAEKAAGMMKKNQDGLMNTA